MDTPKQNPIKGDRVYKTYAGWKRAVKAIDPKAQFYGDKDIGGAFGIGEWDGAEGIIYSDETRVKILKHDPKMPAPGKVRRVNPSKREQHAAKIRVTAKRAARVAGATKSAPVDHVIISQIKPGAYDNAVKAGLSTEPVYYDGRGWALKIENAARWHDIEQAKGIAQRVADSTSLHDPRYRLIFVGTD